MKRKRDDLELLHDDDIYAKFFHAECFFESRKSLKACFLKCTKDDQCHLVHLLFSTLIPINPNAGVTLMEDLFSFKVCFVHFKKLQRKMISDCQSFLDTNNFHYPKCGCKEQNLDMHHSHFFHIRCNQLEQTVLQESDASQPHALFFRRSSQGQETSVFSSMYQYKGTKKEKASHNTPTAKSALKKKSVQYNSDPLFLSLGQGENLCQPSPLRPTSVQITCSRIRSCFHIGLQGG